MSILEFIVSLKSKKAVIIPTITAIGDGSA
jgi:hypothetical protein